MTPHVDILEQPDSLKKPLVFSAAMHGALVAATLLGSWFAPKTQRWGDPNSFGGAVGINPVSTIPMPRRAGVVNPVANATESQVPQPPPQAKKAQRSPAEDPEAIALKGRREPQRQSEVIASRQRFRATEEQPNQLFSEAGQALVSPMFGKAGAGGVGVGAGTPLGDRFGAYASLIQRLVAQKWNTSDVDPRLRTAPPVIVTFWIQRAGTVRGVRVQQSSGNPVLDMSAQRAIYDAGRLPPLPAGYDKDEAQIEFWFELKR